MRIYLGEPGGGGGGSKRAAGGGEGLCRQLHAADLSQRLNYGGRAWDSIHSAAITFVPADTVNPRPPYQLPICCRSNGIIHADIII